MAGSFAVLGDTHFVKEDSHYKALKLGWPGGVTEWNDLMRNGWISRSVMPKVLERIASQKVDLLLHTGDIIPGHCDSDDAQVLEMEHALELLDIAGAPFFFSCGSHDGSLGKNDDAALKRTLYPRISRQLGRECTRSYYAFSRLSCRFISLDYTTWDDAQRDFLEGELRDAPPEEFVVVFGHPPVAPVARPFFTGDSYAGQVAELFSRYQVHAYFCGHTHNHAASIHRFGKNQTLQLMSTPLGFPDAMPTPLADVRPILPREGTFRYGWGFLEDTVAGWWRVTVEEDRLTAHWYSLGHDLEGIAEVSRTGSAEFRQVPAVESTYGPLPDLSQVERARIRLAGSGTNGAELGETLLNGRPLRGCAPLVYFDSRQFIDIPAGDFDCIRKENTLSVELRKQGDSIGGAVIELLLRDGRIVRSGVSGFYTTNDRYAQTLPHVFNRRDIGRLDIEISFQQDS